MPLGRETGNVVFDPMRRTFWAAVVNASPPDQLVQVDPLLKKVTACPGRRGREPVRRPEVHTNEDVVVLARH